MSTNNVDNTTSSGTPSGNEKKQNKKKRKQQVNKKFHEEHQQKSIEHSHETKTMMHKDINQAAHEKPMMKSITTNKRTGSPTNNTTKIKITQWHEREIKEEHIHKHEKCRIGVKNMHKEFKQDKHKASNKYTDQDNYRLLIIAS